ncbi:MAG TPA: ABC transporter permease [Actinomycetota bacterium]|nr:ABC transporter permease [Actinomycetota bacterium]
MFFTYVSRELRRRRRQAIVVGVGLALGVGLVVTVSAMATGVRAAQNDVLQSLYGVGTDITVTRAAGAGTGGPARFGLNAPNPNQQGKRFSRDDILQSPGLTTIPSSQLSTLSSLSGVRSVAGSLSLIAIRAQGTFPKAGDVQFAPPGTSIGSASGGSTTVAPIKVSSYTITGIDVANRTVGPLSGATVTSGRTFGSSDTNAAVAVLDRSYAKQHKLGAGSTITIDGTTFTVIGIVSPTGSGESSNVYVPLARAQKLAGVTDAVNRIDVKATSASRIAAVKKEIEAALPKATVTTAEDLASQVTGSLSSASDLAKNLGQWLSIAALIAAFVVASLLTMSAVGRRVREFGTLKALGWRSRRVVGQVMGEAVVQGILGGVLGIGVGVGGALLVTKLAPSLTATVGAGANGPVVGAGPGPLGGGPAGQSLAGALHTVSVPLTAPIDTGLFVLAIALALLGGVLAGTLGGWRAARMRPAEALRRVE